MAMFSLEEFKTQVLTAGLARTNRFEVFIPPPAGLTTFREIGTPDGLDYEQIVPGTRMLSLMCEQASLPLLNINTKSYRVYGVPEPRPVTSEYGGEGIPLTFHIDREMKVKKFFDQWMQTIVDPITFNVSYKENYSVNIDIWQLDEMDNPQYHIQLIDAFPRSMNLLELNHSSQSQTHRLTVLFAYRKWISIPDTGTEFYPPARYENRRIGRQPLIIRAGKYSLSL